MMLGSIFVIPGVYVYIKRSIGYEIPQTLPFGYWLPFDPYQDIKYLFETVFVVMTCHCFLSALFMMAGDLLLMTFLSHITTQFALLEVRIKKLFDVPIDDQLVEAYPLGEVREKRLENDATSNHDEELENGIEKKLIFIIQRHRALIRFD
ncbi:jg16564 [Pararge aegeria aegeria]|uniref:Jg16564 protein n=1 Tax=Pararge aegeria aegeria TaxID=348720 RepID=A0A8S4QS22_9NEOP|nr:jg16564 [Pararge aegeria aegeria]